jgi:hypothetical protein
MKKIVVCMSLVCALSMQAAEKKSKKQEITTVDQLRTEYLRAREDNQKNGGASYLNYLEVKRDKKYSEKSTVGDTKSSHNY